MPRARPRDRGEDDEQVAERVADAAGSAVPKPKAQRNFTDPDSKIMKTSSGSFEQCYNAQAVVDADHQIIVAADLNSCAADVGNLIPMTEQAAANTGQVPGQVLADAGYCCTDNLDAAAELTASCGAEFFIATARRGHDEPVPTAPPQGADGPEADHQEGPRGLRPAQGDRRARPTDGPVLKRMVLLDVRESHP